jgi:hypothetical protein
VSLLLWVKIDLAGPSASGAKRTLAEIFSVKVGGTGRAALRVPTLEKGRFNPVTIGMQVCVAR